MRTLSTLRHLRHSALLALGLLIASHQAHGQTPPPAWEFTKYFRYNIEKILVNTAAPGSWDVKVVFSVMNPTTGQPWNVLTDAPFQTSGGSLIVDIGWDATTDFVNTGSLGGALAPVVTTILGTAAANPIQLRDVHRIVTPATAPAARPCTTAAECPDVADFYNRFWVKRTVTPVRFTQNVTTGRIGIEGRPVCVGLAGCPAPGGTAGTTYANIPVRSEVADFRFVDSTVPTSAMIDDPRRQVVDFDTKCATCHNGIRLSGNGTPIPRLSLHGNNRNENLKLCVMCHNPNQTDVPYRLITADARTSDPETSIDFKRMIHAIHAGGFRETPLVVIGFRSSINDFSDVRFPGKLRNCLSCHVDIGGKGTFELPLRSYVLGSTVKTGSVYAVAAGVPRTIDVNPANDLRITPTAATCSGCHDKDEVRSHMIRTGGASFETQQMNIGTTVVERCVNCHGPGKKKDVRRVHEVSRTTSTFGGTRD